MKFAARINSLKKSPLYKKISVLDCIEIISKIDGITHIELNYPEHFENIKVEEVKEALIKHNLKLSGIALRYDSKFINGEFTNPNKEIREIAIKETIEAVEICNKLDGEVTTIWLANDGFDYPFQVDYNKALDYEVIALQKVAKMFPNSKISFEYKPYQPRVYSFIGDISTTLMLLDEVGCDNMGVTLDFCHMLMKKENPAYSLALAVRKNRLMGFHLNDGYKDNDDGLMIGSVHLMQTLEFIYYAKRYNYEGINYFDTFPIREDPVKECEMNIKMYKKLNEFIDRIGMDEVEKLINKQDAIAVQDLLYRVINN